MDHRQTVAHGYQSGRTGDDAVIVRGANKTMKNRRQTSFQIANFKSQIKSWFIRFAICILQSAMPLAVQAKVLDRTVATVNDQAIMLSEFQKNATPILEQFQKSAPPAEQTPEHVADIKKRVLDQMVDDRLLVQEAKKKNIHVSQLEVDDGVKKVRSRFNTDEEFNQELKKENMTNDEFRKHIQEQLATIKLIDQEVKAKTPPPSDEEIKEFFTPWDAIVKENPTPGSHPPSELEELKALSKAVERLFGERARARHIFVRVPATASKDDKEAAMKKIKEAQARLNTRRA